ncbi:hypothetical protein D6T91_21465 [Salmonella enterica subsp. houtenae]|nr:hypothetical protein [Salmonella enterica]EDO5295801.1 hypothetical protein [Salmonella enterica subsp. houtenae serovar 40:z4,z24:-]MCR5948367.1 hypothetical protein [Salmonella enterica subsp. houtenae]
MQLIIIQASFVSLQTIFTCKIKLLISVLLTVLLNSLLCNYLSLVDILSYSIERLVMVDDILFFIMLA